MAVKRKLSGKGVSIPTGIVIGVVTAVAVMLIGALVMAAMVINETMPIDGIGVGAMCVIALASALGAWLAGGLTKQKKLLVCGLTALGFYLVLLSITAVFFDGVYSAMGISALMVLLGAGATLIPGLRKKTGKSKIKIPAYR
jgi:putative membrane protein (TIGR04086 family)